MTEIDWYIDFDKTKKNLEISDNLKSQIILSQRDKRSNKRLVWTSNCELGDLLCNYIDLYNSLKREFKSQLISGNKLTQYGYLEFGLVPAIFLPISVFPFEAEIYNKMLERLNRESIKTYILPAYDFIRGYHIIDQIHNDVWVSREELAPIVGKTPEGVSSKDFIRLFMEEFANELK